MIAAQPTSAAPIGARRLVAPSAPPLVPHRALIFSVGRLRQLPAGQEGQGARPVVLMADGTLRQRQTTEGSPVILDGGQLRTLNAATEQLVV